MDKTERAATIEQRAGVHVELARGARLPDVGQRELDHVRRIALAFRRDRVRD